MKRQWYFTNLAALALVGLALVFTGCPDSSPDDDPPPAGLSAPADVAVTAADSQITVTWTAVAGATAYEVWFGATNDSAQAQKFGADVTETTVTITGLANGTEYFVWVRATNTAGASDFSRASGTPVALTATPEAPTTPTVTAGDRQLSVSWTAVSGATGYEVYWHTVNNTSAIPSATKQEVNSGLTATITGLANGTPYFVWVKAKNSAGASGFSSSASGTPVALTATPEAPTTPTVTAGDRQLSVSWTAMEGATGYEVWYGTADNSTNAQQFGSDVSDTSTTITGLTNGTIYYVWVKAKNTAGASGFSSSASGTPVAPTATPEAPPTVTAGDRQLSVSWTAVSGATGYEVYWHTADNTAAIPSANKREVNSGVTAEITGLTNGTEYFVWVKAKNSAGTSGFSPAATGTPSATSIAVGYDNGTITVKNAGTVVTAITLSKTGTTQTVTLNADGSFTGMTWYVDGVNKGAGSSITLNAADYSIRLHSLTFSGWRNGVYLSSAPIPFTVQN